LFTPKDLPLQEVATYDYKALDGHLLYQVVRFEPKTFRQRRSDGNGGWLWNLDGVSRVLYRFPELLNKQSVVLCEGEKDVDAAWALGIPATTNCGGAGKWSEAYTDHLKRLGTARIAIIPDNDVPGRSHADQAAKSLSAVGIQVRVVLLPDLAPKGDLSDYLHAGHSKDDLLGIIRSTPIWTDGASQPSIESIIKQFERLDEGHYRWSVIPPGVTFEIDHLHRYHSDLSGELTVWCDLAGSAKSDNGALLVGHLNLLSLSARKTWAKELQARAKTTDDVDWFQILDNFCNYVGAAEKDGEPVVALTGIRRSLTVPNWYTIDNLTLHQRHPSCLFGWGGVGKSFVALYCGGQLARQGVRVLYVDGELDQWEHDERCAQMFGEDGMTNLYYVRLNNLQVQRDYLKQIITQQKIQFLVVDSITKLAGGKLEESDTAKGYINALDSLKIGSLNVAHITKSAQSGDIRPQDQKVFGASQWDQLLRHSWFVKGDGKHPADAGGAVLGFYLTKSNSARIGQSVGWRFEMVGETVKFTPCDLMETDLAKHEPLKVRLKTLLSNNQPMLSYEDAAEQLDVKAESVRKIVKRHSRTFRKLDGPGGKVLIGVFA